jgi:hypothetical protein
MSAERGIRRWIGFWTGVLVGVVCIYTIYLVRSNDRRQAYAFRAMRAVDASQIQAVARAVFQYEGANGQRPVKLVDLVSAGMLDEAMLYGRGHNGVTGQPDVLYVSAMRKDDPPDMVVLCTLLLPRKDAQFLVVYNDGSFAELKSVDLVTALNRTYAHVGNDILHAGQAGPGT